MSLLARHNVPFFSLVKKTYAFIFSKKRFEDLAFVPSLCLIFIAFLASRCIVEVETPQGKMQSFNFVFALLLLISGGGFFILSMVRTHLYYINGEKKRLWCEKSLYFKGIRYALCFVAACLAGMLVTAFWTLVFYALVFYFLDVGGFSLRYFIMAAVAISPYFIIRFCCIFPAVVSGDKLFLLGSWKITRGVASSLAINYLFVASVPFFAVCFATGFLPLMAKIGIPLIVLNFLSVYAVFFALFVSALFQAVFMNVVYDCLKERKLEDNVTENAFFSIAKNKNSD